MKQHCILFTLICGLTLMAGCSTPLQKRGNDLNPKSYEAGHHFLVANKQEQAGYGLYSYLLFAEAPTEANRGQYLQAIAAVIKTPNVNNLVVVGFDPGELNLTYIPVLTSPPIKKDASPQAIAEMSEWILDHYNYARARILLNRLQDTHQAGLYFISTFSSLSENQTHSGTYLRQNLSLGSLYRTDLTYAWVREFLERAGQPRLWDERSMTAFVRKLRLAIAVVGKNLSIVDSAMDEWLSIVKLRRLLILSPGTTGPDTILKEITQ